MHFNTTAALTALSASMKLSSSQSSCGCSAVFILSSGHVMIAGTSASPRPRVGGLKLKSNCRASRSRRTWPLSSQSARSFFSSALLTSHTTSCTFHHAFCRSHMALPPSLRVPWRAPGQMPRRIAWVICQRPGFEVTNLFPQALVVKVARL